jgi:hypothetical protein
MSLEREIEDLLAVDPSPEFVAKVRLRIAAEPPPSSWWPLRRPVSVAAGIAVVVAAGFLWPSAAPVAPRDGKARAPTGRTSVRTSEAHTASVPSTLAAGSASVDAPSQQRAPAAPSRQAASPVVIRRDEATAMHLLLTRVHDGTLPDMTEALAAVDAAGPEWIAIPPVVIEPITTGEGE